MAPMSEVLDMMEVNWTELMKYLNRENQFLAENSRQDHIKVDQIDFAVEESKNIIYF